MFVAIVTAPICPASATISASNSWNLALSTLCGIPRFLRSSLTSSEDSIVIVPTRTGCPILYDSATSSATALSFSLFVLYTTSLWSIRCTGRFVGTSTTSIPYMSRNSFSSVIAVPVIPDFLLYLLKKFWNVIVASVLLSLLTFTCSFASIA